MLLDMPVSAGSVHPKCAQAGERAVQVPFLSLLWTSLLCDTSMCQVPPSVCPSGMCALCRDCRGEMDWGHQPQKGQKGPCCVHLQGTVHMVSGDLLY